MFLVCAEQFADEPMQPFEIILTVVVWVGVVGVLIYNVRSAHRPAMTRNVASTRHPAP